MKAPLTPKLRREEERYLRARHKPTVATCAKENDTNMLQYLLSRDDCPPLGSTTIENAIILAAQNGHIDSLKTLHQAGVDLKIQNEAAFNEAVIMNQPDLVAWLADTVGYSKDAMEVGRKIAWDLRSYEIKAQTNTPRKYDALLELLHKLPDEKTVTQPTTPKRFRLRPLPKNETQKPSRPRWRRNVPRK